MSISGLFIFCFDGIYGAQLDIVLVHRIGWDYLALVWKPSTLSPNKSSLQEPPVESMADDDDNSTDADGKPVKRKRYADPLCGEA